MRTIGLSLRVQSVLLSLCCPSCSLCLVCLTRSLHSFTVNMCGLARSGSLSAVYSMSAVYPLGITQSCVWSMSAVYLSVQSISPS